MENPADVYEQTAGLILASEEWAKEYKDDPNSFAQLVKAEAKINRGMLEYLKGLSERAPGYVNWSLYQTVLSRVSAATDPFEVDVIVEDLPDSENGLVIQVVFDPISLAVEAGLLASEATYKVILPETSIKDVMTLVTRDQVGYLVGKKVDDFGNLVDNPRAKYRISDATRDQIRQSIRTSLSLGEDTAAATDRLSKVIKDPKRAAKIASTEAVNGYQGGQYQYAVLSGAKQKVWRTIKGACRVCLANAAASPIDIGALFPSGHLIPAAHPWDRCGVRYIYQEELDASA